MLRADGQADGVRPDALIEQLLRRELGMRRRGRVDDEALDVRDVGQQGEDLQVVDEAVRLGLAARDLKGEDGAAAVREVLLIQRVVRVARQRRMVDARDLRVRRQPRDDLLRVLRVAVEAQRECLDALQQQEGVERGDGRAGVAQENGADVPAACTNEMP